MVLLETRSERHRIKKANRNRNIKRFSSGMGAAFMVIPFAAATVLPEKANAESYETGNYNSPESFVESIGYSASSVADANGLYASVMIAQALLESDYGNSSLSSAPNYNLFGVKGSYDGQSVYLPTSEYLEGEWINVTEPFRVYSSYAESFQDHANVLLTASSSEGDYHYSGAWKGNTWTYADATSSLSGTYATDPDYASKLNWLIEAYNLTRFDSGAGSGYYYDETANVGDNGYGYDQTAETPVESNYVPIGVTTYTIVSGDTLWDIAQHFGLSVDQLMAMNGLSADLITIGQVLQVA